MNFFKKEQSKLILPKGPDFKVFATMCVHRHVDVEALGSMIQLMLCPNPRFAFSRRSGDALIDRSRSIEASRFLADKSYDVMLFLDDDIIYDPKDLVQLVRLVKEQDLDIVGATYSLKKERGHLTTKLLKDNAKIVLGKGGGVYEVAAISTGCMAINRKVLEKMAGTMPLCKGMGTEFYPFFQPMPYFMEENNAWYYLSEDWAFTQRARDLGFKIWLDSRIKLQHAGRTTYSWDDLSRPPKEEHETFVYTENFAALPAEAEAPSRA